VLEKTDCIVAGEEDGGHPFTVASLTTHSAKNAA